MRRVGKRADGRVVPLTFAGTTSLFGAGLEVTEPGTYQVQVSVYDPKTGNTTVFTVLR